MTINMLLHFNLQELVMIFFEVIIEETNILIQVLKTINKLIKKHFLTYSFTELGNYDLPANIDKALKESGR